MDTYKSYTAAIQRGDGNGGWITEDTSASNGYSPVEAAHSALLRFHDYGISSKLTAEKLAGYRVVLVQTGHLAPTDEHVVTAAEVYLLRAREEAAEVIAARASLPELKAAYEKAKDAYRHAQWKAQPKRLPIAAERAVTAGASEKEAADAIALPRRPANPRAKKTSE